MVHLDFLRQDLSLDLEHTGSARPADQRVLGTLCLASTQHCWNYKHMLPCSTFYVALGN